MDKSELISHIDILYSEIAHCECDPEEKLGMVKELESIDNKINNLIEWINLHNELEF